MPPGNSSRIYIAEGFYHDCEELIQKCLRADVVNYHVFCNIWKDMNFAQLFWGRQLASELAELSEEVIYVAKTYFFADNNNMEESIAGLFLVYALLNLQPYPGFAPLRITPDDVVPIKKIEMFARRTNRMDVLYILGSVLINGPVEYHAQMRDFGFEVSIKKYLLGYSGIDMPSQRTTGVLSHRCEELDILREINSLTKKYSESKDVLTKAGIWSEKLNYSNSTLATDLNNSFRKVLSGTVYSEHLEDDVTDEVTETDSYNNLQSIKNKAMAINYGIAKHREGVEERKKNREEKSIQNLTSPKQCGRPRKIRAKRKFNYKSLRRKRSKVEISSESESDGDIELDSSDDTINETSGLVKTLPKEIETANKEINIEIESLPVFISVDRNKEYEFEIIDNMQIETTVADSTDDNVPNVNNKRKNDNDNNDEPLNKVRKVVNNTSEIDLPVIDVTDKEKEVQDTKTAKINKTSQVVNVKPHLKDEESNKSQTIEVTNEQKPKKVLTPNKQEDNVAELKENQNFLLDKEDIKTAKGKDKQKTQTNEPDKQTTAQVTESLDTANITDKQYNPTAITADGQEKQNVKAIHKRKTVKEKTIDKQNSQTAKVKEKPKDKPQTQTAKRKTVITKAINRIEPKAKDDEENNKVSPMSKITDTAKIPTEKVKSTAKSKHRASKSKIEVDVTDTQANKKVKSKTTSKSTGGKAKATKSKIKIDNMTSPSSNTRSSMNRHSGSS